MLWLMILAVFVAGCVGGSIPLLTNRQRFGSRGLVYEKKACSTWFPGSLGHVLVGGVAAVVFWGLYGPLGEGAILGGDPNSTGDAKLSLANLMGSVVVGIGGPDWLQAQAERRCASRRRNS